jgi:iron complex outermembrane recepter protein
MFRYIYTLLVSFALLGLASHAQGQDARIQGQVSDTSGAVIPRALVRAVDQQTGKERKTETNDRGQYSVPGLNPSSYKIFVEAPGFSTAVSDPITLSAAQDTVSDFTLRASGSSASVVVTAEKREENLRDVPVPVSVLDAEALADTSQVNLRDYALTVPGFSVTPGYSGTQDLSIRGITTGGFSIPTVGVMIDDVPYGNSSATETNIVPDVDPGDLKRIEILRGPQGTLYGANSMGGLIKYVMVDPSPRGFSSRFEAGVSGVHNGAEPGYNLRGAVNVPMGKRLAVRASGFFRQDPGFIDNPFLNRKGVNEAHASGGRLAGLWQPSEHTSLKLNGLYQYTKQDGVSEIDKLPGLGDLQQNYIAGVGGFKKTIQAYSATLQQKAGIFDLTSVTGFNINRLFDSFDYTYYLSDQTFQLFGVTGVPYTDFGNDKNVSEEMRVTSPIGNSSDLLVGGIYRREHLNAESAFYGSDPMTGQIYGQSVDFGNSVNVHQEYAAFANFSHHFTERFDVQVGGRETHISDVTDPTTATGPLVEFFYGEPSPFTSPELKSGSNTFTYSAAARFKLTDEVMTYVRLASGFRPGGANQIGPGIPRQYSPDKTENYEIGLKGDFANHKVSVDTSIYYIDWQNLQFQLFNPEHFPYTGNGGTAKSEGVEFSATARPLTGLTLAGWTDYDDAALTETVTDSGGYLIDGARIPNTSRWSGNFSVNQAFPLPHLGSGFVEGAVRYVGDRQGLFQATSERQNFPSYTRTDLRAGIDYHSWLANIYVNNAADERTFLNGGIGYLYSFAFVVMEPRVIGFSVSKSF